MFIVLKKKWIILVAVVLALVLLGGLAGGIAVGVKKAAAFGKKVIVIDAGHGGSDKGVIGQNGTVEAQKNLEIAKKLQVLLEDAGFLVVMTRTTDAGADKPTGGFKQEDFANRKQTIENANPDLIVSIHCNKFPSRDRRGIQVFYNKLSADGKKFAGSLQNALNSLNAKYVGRVYSELAGEYFMLNCHSAPSAIVECGFLSNAEDEALLCDEGYIEALVYELYGGIISYL